MVSYINNYMHKIENKDSRIKRLDKIKDIDQLLYKIDDPTEDMNLSENYTEPQEEATDYSGIRVDPKDSLRANIDNKIFRGIDKDGRHGKRSHAPILRKAIHDKLEKNVHERSASYDRMSF